MIDQFVFHNRPSVHDVLTQLSWPLGKEVTHHVVSEFSSLVAVLQHTHAVGDSTVIAMPDGDTVSFVHAGRHVVAQAIHHIAAAKGLDLGSRPSLGLTSGD